MKIKPTTMLTIWNGVVPNTITIMAHAMKELQKRKEKRSMGMTKKEIWLKSLIQQWKQRKMGITMSLLAV